METVSLKLDNALAKEMAACMRFAHYSTKTEFIRESLREKVARVREERAKRKAWNALFAARGAFKGKGKFEKDKDFYKWRKEYGEKLAEEVAREGKPKA